MRLDKFLKVSRLVKQRPRAKSLCDSGAVTINGVAAKAAQIVKTGDRIEITMGDRIIKAEVLLVPDGTVSKTQSKELIKITGDDLIDETW